MRQFKCPSLGSSGELGPPCSILLFFFREGGSQREGGIDPDAGISPFANRMGKHAFQTHFDGKKYTNENIYARCQSSVEYLAW